MTETNWARNVTYTATEIHHPASLAELRSLVAGRDKIRALGTRHAFNTLADTPDELVSVANLPRTVEVDSAAATVRVSAGLRYAEIAEEVDRAGFALPNLASLPHISVAGATATATHGSGVGNGSLATSVAALELVTATGDLLRLDRGHEDFAGAVVSLGALGVVTSLTLDLVPSFDIRQYVYTGLPLGSDLLAVLGGAYSVSLFTDWKTDVINQVWIKQLGDGVPELPATRSAVQLHPVPGNPPEYCTQQLGVPGRWYERLPHFRPEFTPSAGDELQAEFMVARADAALALQAINQIRDRVHPVLQVSEIRTIAADEQWLSPYHQRDTVSIHFTWIADTPAVLPVIKLVERQLEPFDPRPHWAKLFSIAPRTVRSRYPRLPDFQALARRLDPAGKFGNPMLSGLLELPGAQLSPDW
ncbi:MAG: D-arabinono-1,4-lactone oxidase [Kibdelosporangium sp.]